MIVKGIMTSDEEEIMSLGDYFIWALSGAKQAYETNLPEGSPLWEQLSDEDKLELLAHEISCSDGDVEFIPEMPENPKPSRVIGIIRHIDDLGRIVIPKEFRSRFEVKEGDPFELFACKDGSYLIVPYKD